MSIPFRTTGGLQGLNHTIRLENHISFTYKHTPQGHMQMQLCSSGNVRNLHIYSQLFPVMFSFFFPLCKRKYFFNFIIANTHQCQSSRLLFVQLVIQCRAGLHHKSKLEIKNKNHSKVKNIEDSPLPQHVGTRCPSIGPIRWLFQKHHRCGP